MTADFFASLVFYLAPFLTGRIFTKNFLQAFVLGAIIWFCTFFVLSSSVVKIGVIIFSGLGFLKLIYDFIREKPVFSKETVYPVAAGVFSTIVYFLIWKKFTPYPLQLNWDIYEHIALANEIIKGNISFLTTRISDTFTVNSYSPLFSVLLSIPKIVSEKSLLGIYWWLEYWHFILTSLASFLLAKRFLKDNFLSLTAGILSALTFQSVVSYTTLFLLPQTLTALVAALILSRPKLDTKWLILSSAFLFLLHYVIGTLAVGLIWIFHIAETFNIKKRLVDLGLFVFLGLSSLLIGLNFAGKWHLLATEEAVHFNFSLSEKISFMGDWYSLFFLLFIPGSYLLIRRGDRMGKILLSVSILVLSLSLAPFSYFLKFYTVAHYLVNVILIAGFAFLTLNLSRVLRIFALSVLLISMFYVFYVNQKEYKKPLHFGVFETQISKNEINAGKWLSDNTEKNSFLISDPSLQYILEAVSEVNSQGGTYMRLDTRQTLSGIENSSSPSVIKRELLSISDSLPKEKKDVYFILGGRYFEWQRSSQEERNSTFYNIWAPRNISENDRRYIDFLEASEAFEKVYENEELVILKII